MNNRIHYELDRFKQHLKKNYPTYLSILIGILIYKKGYKNGVRSAEFDEVAIKLSNDQRTHLCVTFINGKKILGTAKFLLDELAIKDILEMKERVWEIDRGAN